VPTERAVSTADKLLLTLVHVREGRRSGSVDEFEGIRRGMLTKGKWCNPVLTTRGLRMMAAFWAGIPVEVTQEAGVVPRCRRAAIGTPF